MATGKHYRSDNSAPRKDTPPTRHTSAQPAAPAKTDDYEDLYSYEEPRGAKRGTRRPTYHTPAPQPAKKPSKAPFVLAILCLLAAAGIVLYMLWDLGIVRMLLSILK